MAEEQLEQERYELREAPAYSFVPDRRDFLATLGGGLLILAALAPDADAQESGRGRAGASNPQHLGAWLHIGPDGGITVYSGKAEVGQNIRTSLTQAVAEELHAAPGQIGMVLGDTLRTPYDMGTFGSRTTPLMAPQLRKTAHVARRLLLDAAAQRWKASRAELTASEGRIHHRGTGDSLGYGELAAALSLTAQIAADEPLTPAADWKVSVKSLGKINARDIVTGREKYVSDLRLPGMWHGRVVRPSAFRAKLVAADLEAAKRLPEVAAVRDGEFVGVACADQAQLDAAAQAVHAEWTAPQQVSSRELFNWLKSSAKTAAALTPVVADAVVESVYQIPYIAHTPLEPRCAVAHWENGGVTVWTGTQVPFGVRAEVAEAFGLKEDQVRVIAAPTGSGYGGKHTGECAVEAARLAKAAGRPVKLQWTREEEHTWAYFRPAGLIEIRSGAAKDGRITDWQFRNYNSGGAALRSPYAIPNQVAEFHASDSPLRQGSYRGLAATANHFARECHMDEMAAALGLEPAAFRRKNAADPRLRAVIDAAAERFRWGLPKERPGQGFGMMAGFDKGGYVAACAEVTVTGDRIRVDRIVQAFECGAIVNPDQLRNQVIGGLIMGLGGALMEQIDFENGRILNARLSKYRVPRFSDVPEIEAVLIDRKDLPSAGAGETPIVAAAPAIANAVFDATKRRLRALPLRLG